MCYSGRTATKVAGAEDERRVWCLAKTTPPKTNMTIENTNHFKVYLLLKMVIFHCHAGFSWVFPGDEKFLTLFKNTGRNEGHGSVTWPLLKIGHQQNCQVRGGFKMDVSENSGISKSSILMGLSIINHPFWGTTTFGNIHMFEVW